MKRAISIRGPNVHDVGYRAFIADYGANSGFTRLIASNQKEAGTQKVTVLVEDTEENIDAFLAFLHSSQPENAVVSEISDKPFEGDVQLLSLFFQNLLIEQLNKGIPAILDIQKSQRNTESSLKNIEAMQREMCIKQDETISEIQGLRHDISTTFDQRLKNIEEEQRSMKEAIRRLGVTV